MLTNHRLGKKSKIQYDTLHPDLQLIVDWGLKYCLVDFSLHEGHRTVAKQFGYYKKGRKLVGDKWVLVNPKAKITNVDGLKVKGKHNYSPSLALDFKAYVPDKPQLTWDAVHLTYIGASLILIAEYLHENQTISHKLRWGNNWNMNGDLSDNRLVDMPHVELYKPK